MGISVGLVGLGSFGSIFAPLFKSHPLVDRLGLCDREPSRVAAFADDPWFADKLHERDRYATLDEICAADFDALVVITQPWLHAPQCVQALESGKHVYSAVPVISVPDNDEILEWCDTLVKTVERTGRQYMLGETTFYRPEAMFCRRKAAEGAFGDFVYAEGEYIHDVDSFVNLRKVYRDRTASASGREWVAARGRYEERAVRGGPMHYPTHSVSGPVSVMGAHALRVNAYGYANREGDPFFADQAFSNEMALFRMSNGTAVRILEMRESPGKPTTRSETFRVFGTRGGFSEDRWSTVERPDHDSIDLDNLPQTQTVSVARDEMFDPLPAEVVSAFTEVMNRERGDGSGEEIDFRASGHGGAHPHLVHEFVDAVASDRVPAINVWEAVRYMAMGVAAHESALRDGATVTVADWGDAPSA
jgi:predicted dehydrogenase